MPYYLKSEGLVASDEVREITSRWIDEYNVTRPHDARGGFPSCVFANQTSENSILELELST